MKNRLAIVCQNKVNAWNGFCDIISQNNDIYQVIWTIKNTIIYIYIYMAKHLLH